jgi:hypothetical protein
VLDLLITISEGVEVGIGDGLGAMVALTVAGIASFALTTGIDGSPDRGEPKN